MLAELAARDVTAFSSDGQIRAAYPVSPAPTPIQVTWAGGPLTYAMCAIDALGISAMLGHPATITAVEPGPGRIITIHAEHDHARWTRRARSYSQAGRASADHHPAITGMVLNQAQALRQGVAELGAFLRIRDGTTQR